MSFLQPMLLAGLPLVALPIIIHLINQRRYQTMRWGAMMFLLAANRMSRGYARIRRWLIMAFRMLAIAGLILAVSRPLAGGWLGLTAGGRPDTTLILLDRSPSMQQSSVGGGGSKLETGRRQLVQTLELLGSSRWVLIESATNRPREIESPRALLGSTAAEPISAASDLPAMLLAARDYIRQNNSGRTEIWICSDLRANDWDAEGGRWQSLRDGFLEFAQGVRLHLLAYPQAAPDDLAVRVTDVRRQNAGDGAELLVSFRLTREVGGPEAGQTRKVPVQFEIDGARSEITVDMTGPKVELKDHRIPLEKTHVRGWGRISIAADDNPADNDDWFAFDLPAPRHAAIVTDDLQAARPLALAASIAPDPAIVCSSEVVMADNLATLEWEKLALLIWQAPLPEGDAAKPLRRLVERGGQVLVFPPRIPGGGELYGVRWTSWVDGAKETAVEGWRGDQDLLAQTQSGAPLPVGQLAVKRYCGISGESTPLATLKGGAPLLARAVTPAGAGGVTFCAAGPGPGESSLATGGVVLYVMIQRAQAAGAAALENTRRLDAGKTEGEHPEGWKRLAGAAEALSIDYPLHRGIYRDGERLIAVRRAASEDQASILADDRVAGLFRGLDFARVDDQAGNLQSVIQEIWRFFLGAMLVAMLVEAILCLPRKPEAAPGGPVR